MADLAATLSGPKLTFGMGVFPYTRFRSPSEMAEVVVEAEELGFDVVGLPEHLLTPQWPTADPVTKYWHDLPTLITFLAGATKRIRFLTSVLVVPYHPPIQMAKALATADVLSEGRLMLGVGAGWMEAEFRRLKIPFAERAAITDEYLRAMIELWTADAPAFEGQYTSFRDVSFLPKPVQTPHPPIYVGGTGRRPFRRVAELGQGWFPMTATLDEIRRGIAEIEGLRVRSGRPSAPLWVGYSGFSMGSDKLVAGMRHNVDGGESSAPAATPDEAIEQLAALRAAGVTHVGVGVTWTDATSLKAELRRFAGEVMPAFR